MLEIENETKSKILNDSSGCFIHLTRNMISRSSNQYISGSRFSDISLSFVVLVAILYYVLGRSTLYSF